jgi:hypothetical protein
MVLFYQELIWIMTKSRGFTSFCIYSYLFLFPTFCPIVGLDPKSSQKDQSRNIGIRILCRSQFYFEFLSSSDNNNYPQDRFLAHEKMQRKPSRRSCVKISGCLSRGTRASFRNFSNKEDEGRFIF